MPKAVSHRTAPPRPPPVTEVTEELLARVWTSRPAAHGWLGVRQTSVKRLGLQLERTKGGFRLIRASVQTVTVKPPPTPEKIADTERFEVYANEVDNFLNLAQEQPERDAVVRELLKKGISSRAAADHIISCRSALLERAVEPSEETYEPTEQEPLLFHAPPQPKPLAPPQKPAPAEVVVALPKPPKRAKKPRQTSLPGVKRPLIASAMPPARVLKPGPIVINLLSRPGGATLAELQQAIGWIKPPHPLFIKDLVRRAGRASELMRQGSTYALVAPSDRA